MTFLVIVLNIESPPKLTTRIVHYPIKNSFKISLLALPGVHLQLTPLN